MSTARTGPQPGAYRALLLASLAFALCFSVWGLVAPLAPQFQQLYELSNTQISVVIATPVLLGALFRIPMGLLTDRFGGRLIFPALMLVLVVPVLFIGLLGGSFGGLLFWGFFLGLAGSSFAIGVPFVSKWFPPHMQGLALGIYGVGTIGTAVAAYTAPAIAAFYGWQWAFWVFIVPLIAMAVVFWVVGRDAPSAGPRPSLAAGVALFRQEAMPWVLSLLYFLTFGGFVAMGIYLPTLLVDLFGYTPSGAGLRAAGFVALAVLTRPVGGWLADRIGGSRTLMVVFAILPVMALILSFEPGIFLFTIGALSSAVKLRKLANIFFNPDLPSIDDFYEPWTYDYETLTNAKLSEHQPVAQPISQLSGEPIDLQWGPNWDDDLAGAPETGHFDPNIRGELEESVRFEYEKVFMAYLPRICEHCLNPSCVASCPSGAMYKREEDGIVLVDQEQCRGWRYCVSGCPYKKVYFNWDTGKAEKCTLCYPRIEGGQPTICSETCVGRLRYIGLVLYDADRVEEAASTPDEKDLLEAQRSVFLDPNDPEVVEQARFDGIPDDWISAAQRSPIYPLAINWGIALPLHPEYRTMPMVWYVPPLSPVMGFVEGEGSDADPDDVFPAIDDLRIPIQYLANLLSAGDEDVIRRVFKRLAAMRGYMREKNLSGAGAEEIASSVGMQPRAIEDMYRLLAIAKYEDRFVIPLAHKEIAHELYEQRGSQGLDFAGGHAPAASRDNNAYSCSLDFTGGPGSCASDEGSVASSSVASSARNQDFYDMKDELEKKVRELGGKVTAPNVQLFTSKKNFESFHLKGRGPQGADA